MQSVTVLGATGVIGTETLDVLRRHKNEFFIHALATRSASERLFDLCVEFKPKFVAIAEELKVAEFKDTLRRHSTETTVLVGSEAIVDICSNPEVDIVVTGISGGVGLKPTVAAIRAGVRVAVANKEPIVMLGPLVRREVKLSGAIVLPVDSEHNAIFQCCASAGEQYRTFNRIPSLKRILLTGSGGPFLDTPLNQLSDITPEQAVAHPIWPMGAKISVDSATMMNKGLEIIEARWLFEATHDQIQVVIHPQGVVHSMVEYEDGSVIAELATPDMRVPISNALFWPNRGASGAPFLNITDLQSLEFRPPDWERFPCLKTAAEVSKLDGTLSVVLNAANEVAVDAFLSKKARFTNIVDTVCYCVDKMASESVESIDQILEVDQTAREVAREYLSTLIHK